MKSINLITDLLVYFDNLTIQKLTLEPQNAAYEGACFQLKGQRYRSRLAKLTPKKAGYFVVFWEKDANADNQPYDFATSPDQLIISVIDGHRKGQFIFPKSVLLAKGILSGPHGAGKMASRVYPSWVKDLNPSVQGTKRWQAPYFIDLSAEIDRRVLHLLYFPESDGDVSDFKVDNQKKR